MQVSARVFLALVVIFLGTSARLASQQPSPANPPASVDFAKDVQPIFNAKCLACHSGSGAKAGLQLDTYENVIAGGDDGKVVVPGDSKSSVLAQRISDTTGMQMPPQGPLSSQEIATIVAWIDQGAKPGASGQSSANPSAN